LDESLWILSHHVPFFAAFVWLKCEGDVEDCETFLRGYKIITRSGTQFGASPKYVRISMLDTDETFIQFIERLSAIQEREWKLTSCVYHMYIHA